MSIENKERYIDKVNSIFDGRKDKNCKKMTTPFREDYPRIVQFEGKDIGCFFLASLGYVDTVELMKLKIYDTNKGYGTRLLHLLCDEADKYKITLWVWPLPEESEKTIPLDKLKSWYNKFGFEQSDGTFMIRKSKEI